MKIFMNIKNIRPLLLSTFILVMGIGLYNILLPVRLNLRGYSSYEIGLITAAYYAGMFLGAFHTERLILRIGHIRAFAFFTSLLTASILLPGLWEFPFTWAVFRFVGGISLAGLYIVIESWILAFSATEGNRGKNLAFYMISYSLGSSLGPLFLNTSSPETLGPFCLTAIFLAFSTFPLILTKSKAPEFHLPSALKMQELFKLSPAGFLGGILSGLLFSAVLGFLPVVAQKVGFPLSQTTYLMTTLTLGGLIFQYPVGFFTDRFDPRFILLGLTLLVSLASGAALLFFHSFMPTYLGCVFIIGGGTYALYPVALSCACAYVKSEDIVNVSQGLNISYGLGAMGGPVLAAWSVDFLGPKGLFFLLIGLAGSFCAALGYFRVLKGKRGRYIHPYVPFPSPTPVGAEMDPRYEKSHDFETK